jgi:hypothetical protein
VFEAADSVEEWMTLQRRSCQAARVLLRAKIAADAWNHAGFSVECALKAAIMRHQRLNTWPSRAHRPELYTHNLRDLARLANITFLTTDPTASRWCVALGPQRYILSPSYADQGRGRHHRSGLWTKRSCPLADRTLPAAYLSAGQDYLSALRKLGLDPNALLWAIDKTLDDFVLVLITDHFDFTGPLEIYRLLTQAYNLSATPKDISPFIIRLHSPRQAVGASVLSLQADVRTAEGKRSETLWIDIDTHDLRYRNSWVYQVRHKKLSPASRQHQWNRFKNNIERLAA